MGLLPWSRPVVVLSIVDKVLEWYTPQVVDTVTVASVYLIFSKEPETHRETLSSIQDIKFFEKSLNVL